MSQNATQTNQASLDSISYDEYTRDTVPSDRRTASFDGQSDFYETVTKGDVLWIDGTEFVVVGFGEHLIGPAPVNVVRQDGTRQDQLVVGGVNDDSSETFAAWGSELRTLDDDETVSRANTIASIDRVHRLETGSLEYLHTWVPDSKTRTCPACDSNTAGTPHHLEQQNDTYVEIRRCTNTDCHHIYRFTQTNPDTSPARIIEHNPDNGFSIESISGLYKQEEQDDFTFPLSTHDGRDDGFYTPTQIADFLNRKFIPESILTHLDTDTIPLSALLTPVQNDTIPDDVSRDDAADAFIELLHRLVADDIITDASVGALSVSNIKTNTGTITTTVIDDISVDTVSMVTHPAFYEYVTTALREPFGVVSTKINRSNERVVTWDDEPGYDSMMTVRFTEITPDRQTYDLTTFYALNRQGHDLRDYAPQ